MPPPVPIAGRLKALREAAGLSQQALAMRAGVSVSVVFQIEQGKRKDPRLSTLVALARGLGVELSAFQPPEEPPKKRKEK